MSTTFFLKRCLEILQIQPNVVVIIIQMYDENANNIKRKRILVFYKIIGKPRGPGPKTLVK